MKKKILFLSKVILTTVLCSVIIMKADWGKIQIALYESNLIIIVIVVICMFMNLTICAKKWQILLGIHGIHKNHASLTKYYLTGMFFSNFLPSTIGGDGYRMLKIYQVSGSKSAGIIPIVIERMTGIAVLLFLGLLAAIVSFLSYGDRISELGLLFSLTGSIGTILVSILFFNRKFQLWWLRLKIIPEKIKKISVYLNEYRRHWGMFWYCILISFIFHLFLFFYRYLLMVAVGESCSFFSLMLVIALSSVVALLPITINGIGLMDGSFIYLISQFGISYESAVIIMLLQRTLTIGVSLVGGLVYLKEKEVSRAKNTLKENVEKFRESLL